VEREIQYSKRCFMAQITISANEIQQLAFQIFGDKKITAITADGAMFLTPETGYVRGDNQRIALNKLCGMFKNTNLLSSDDFAKNKRIEKEFEERKI
jgi:hypothetical protein